MQRIEASTHAQEQRQRRGIAWDWVWWTIVAPHRVEGQGKVEHLRFITTEQRTLRVVLNTCKSPPVVVTVHWERKWRRLGDQL